MEQKYFIDLVVEHRDKPAELATVGELLEGMFREQKMRLTKVCLSMDIVTAEMDAHFSL